MDLVSQGHDGDDETKSRGAPKSSGKMSSPKDPIMFRKVVEEETELERRILNGIEMTYY